MLLYLHEKGSIFPTEEGAIKTNKCGGTRLSAELGKS